METIKVGDKTVPLNDFNKWLDALRSGEYKQTSGHLHDEHGFCCLGVACKVLIPENEIQMSYGCMIGTLPQEQFRCPIWLSKINDDFYYKTKKSLVHLNDAENLSFEEIADLLQAVYILKVLE